MLSTNLGWMQLRHQKLRTVVAILGIAFADILILMQLGFRTSLLESAVRYQRRLHYDIALFSKESSYIVRSASFSSRRLYQALGVDGVESVTPVYAHLAVWKNPYNHEMTSVFALGVDPDDAPLLAPGVRENIALIRQRDVVLFDARSRPEHGPVADRLRAGESIATEINNRRVTVGGLFEMGTSFGIDGSILTSEDNFLRLFPNRQRTQIDVGLIRIRPGEDPEKVRDAVRALLPKDVLVLTKADFVAREMAYWNGAQPIGYIFAFGAIMGFVVGSIIVYQILFADVSDHLAEYATLRAMGYSNGFVSGVVLQQAMILAVLGYLPGMLICVWLYHVAGAATRLPLYMTWERGATVLVLTIAMCAIAGLIALRKVRSLDPAEVF